MYFRCSTVFSTDEPSAYLHVLHLIYYSVLFYIPYNFAHLAISYHSIIFSFVEFLLEKYLNCC